MALDVTEATFDRDVVELSKQTPVVVERGAEEEALEAVQGHPGDFDAQGIAARVQLAKAGVGKEAFEALARGERDTGIDALIAEVAKQPGNGDAGATRDLLRQAIVGVI